MGANRVHGAAVPGVQRWLAGALLVWLSMAAVSHAEEAPYVARKVSFHSIVLGADTEFNIILPPDYEQLTEPLPVVYALHGALQREDSLLPAFLQIAEELRPRVVFVLPDSCPVCNWTNGQTVGEFDQSVPGVEEVQHVNVSSGGVTVFGVAWEDFFIQELMPYVEASFPVRSDRAGRGITGHSMGGAGTSFWMTKYPDLFAFAYSMSSAGDMDFMAAALEAGQPGTRAGDWGVYLRVLVYGDPVLNEWRWMDSDPWELSPNLIHQPIVIGLSAGDGRCSDDPENPPGLDGGCSNNHESEVARRRQTIRYSERLDELGIPHTLFLYGPASHTEFRAAIRDLVPAAEAAFAANLSDRPEPFQYQTMRKQFSIWGYDVRVKRPNQEFLHLEGVTPTSFRVRGTGQISMTTAPIYAPSSAYRVVLANSDGSEERPVYADSEGRIYLSFRAGPDRYANQRRQRSDMEPELVFPETTVSIEALP